MKVFDAHIRHLQLLQEVWRVLLLVSEAWTTVKVDLKLRLQCCFLLQVGYSLPVELSLPFIIDSEHETRLRFLTLITRLVADQGSSTHATKSFRHVKVWTSGFNVRHRLHFI